MVAGCLAGVVDLCQLASPAQVAAAGLGFAVWIAHVPAAIEEPADRWPVAIGFLLVAVGLVVAWY